MSDGRRPAWRSLTVERMLRLTAERTPHKVAVRSGTDAITWFELDEAADRAANGLLAVGARPGDTVGLLAENSASTLALMLGMSRVGMVVLPLNPASTASEIAFQTADVSATLTISDQGPSAADVIAAGASEPPPPALLADEDQPFWIRFTSGTTGRPRAFAVTNRAMSLLVQNLATELQYRFDDVLLVTAPLAHAAFAFAAAITWVGGSMTLTRFAPDSLWTDCRSSGATQLFLVPTMLTMALEHAGEAPSLRRITLAGSALPPAVRQRATDRFTRAELVEIYGASELGNITALHHDEAAAHSGSVGLPRFGYSVRVLDDDGAPVQPGTVGTIYVQGPSMSNGFIGSVPALPDTERDGWVTPWDMGWLDDDGYLHLADRRTDLIVSGGYNVYPAEVENALLDTERVRQAVVIGTSDPVWGQVVTAVVVGDVSRDALDAHCRSALAAYKVPRRYEFVEEIPTTASGKPLRRVVRDRFS